MLELPEGFERRRVDGAEVVVRAELADDLLEAGIADPAGLVRAAPTEHRGRARLARVEAAGGRFVVRALQRGGLVGKLVRQRSLDRDRAVAELAVAVGAAARGVPTLEVVAAVTRRVGLGYTHGLVSREEVGARDLMAALVAEPEGPARWQALRAAGEAVAALHRAGVDHVDLNLKNVLLTVDGRALVIDLDRCRLGTAPAAEATCRTNLLRLLRSWVKLGVAAPGAARPRDPVRFARAYAGGDRERLRRLVRAGSQAGFALHRLRWRLFPPKAPQ